MVQIQFEDSTRNPEQADESYTKDVGRLGFAELYDRYAQQVYSFVVYRVGDRDEAEDITAEIFEQAFRSISTFDPQRGRLVAWLFGIAHKRVARHHQRRKKREKVDSDTDRIEALESLGRSPEEWLLAREDRELLLNAITRLRKRDRQLITLRYQGDLTNGEIAELLGVPRGTVAVRVHRAVERLRDTLNTEATNE